MRNMPRPLFVRLRLRHSPSLELIGRCPRCLKGKPLGYRQGLRSIPSTGPGQWPWPAPRYEPQRTGTITPETIRRALEVTAQLRSEFRPAAGECFRVWLPGGGADAFGPEPFEPGQGFTVRAGEEIWRGILVAVDPAGDGTELVVALADCTPVGYGRQP